MEMPMTETKPAGVRLIHFLSERSHSILRREENNETSAYLYGVGDYWIAMERSAYQLKQLFPNCELYPMQFADMPFPVVLASVPDHDMVRYTRQHIVRRKDPDHLVLSVPLLSQAKYGRWHQKLCQVFKTI